MQITLLMTGAAYAPLNIDKSGYFGSNANILADHAHILDGELGRLEQPGQARQMEQAAPFIAHQFGRLIEHQLIHQPLIQ